MPNSVSIYNYPAEFLELAAKLQDRPGEVITIPCKDKIEAQRLRFKLYGFQKAMKKEGMDKDFPVATSAEICIRGNDVTIQNRDTTWAAKLVKNALHPAKEPK